MRLCHAGLVVTLVLAAASAGVSAEPARRNVVLLIADDLGLDLGCYGHPTVRSPNLDALAKSGTRFTHAFATTASCSASRAVLLTGLYTHSNGQYGHAHQPHNFHTHAWVKSLPRLLRDHGYRTGILGKLHVNPAEVYPFDADMTTVMGTNHNVAEIARRARQFFSDSADRPFFLVVGYGDTHRTGKGFGNDRTYPGVTETHYDPKDVVVPYFLPDVPEVRRELAEYYQAVSRLDQGIGQILQPLGETKNADSTLVIFLSDNGIPFPGAKTTQYDAGLRLPLIVSSPAQKRRGVVSRALVNWADIAPTILDWTGASRPNYTLPGRSFLPILDDDHPTGWDTVFGSHVSHEITMYYPMRTIRTRRHKLILNLAHHLDYPFASDLFASATWQGILQRKGSLGQRSTDSYLRRPREELFDLDTDPNELKNVAGDPHHAAVLNELRARLKEWQEKTRDPWLVKYRYE
jgi:N-sulfoglucosamine sulfohydrolase